MPSDNKELQNRVSQIVDDLVHCSGEDSIIASTFYADQHTVPEILALIADQCRLARVELINLYGTPRCEYLHHSKKDQHSALEDCPVVAKIKTLEDGDDN
jgi:hypothetical protein